MRRRRRNRRPWVVLVCLLVAVFLAGTIGRVLYRKDGVFPTEVYGVPVHTALIPETSQGRPGTKRTIKYIVIHETANTAATATAKSHAEFLQNGGEGSTSWHYTVDDHEIYHHLPDDEVAWHAGDKKKNGGGNMNGIGIELCVNAGGDFNQTMDNAAKLTAYLLDQYGLSINAVKQHADFMEKDCPHTIRSTGRWDEFLSKVEGYLRQDQ